MYVGYVLVGCSPTEFQYFKRSYKHIYYGIYFIVCLFATYTNAIVNWVT